MLANLCEALHVLPSQILKEDHRLIQMLVLCLGVKGEADQMKAEQAKKKQTGAKRAP